MPLGLTFKPVRLKWARSHEVDCRMVKSYRPGGVGMLPAEAGTYLVHAYFDDNEVDLVRANVLGWQVGAERSLTPLVVDSRAVVDDGWHVLHPDGRVEGADGRGWDDLDDWLADERRRWRAARSDDFENAPSPRPAPVPVARGKDNAAAKDSTQRRSYYDPGPEILQRPTG